VWTCDGDQANETGKQSYVLRPGTKTGQPAPVGKVATSTSTSADIVIEFAPTRPRPVIPHRALAHTR
jgi:hypothetical protein